MNDIWRHNNKLREFQEWVIISNLDQLESSGIYDLLKETYSEKIANIFARFIDSDEYEDCSYWLQYDATYGPETAEISNFASPGEYVELFSEKDNAPCLNFHTISSFGSILTKRYLNRELEDIIATDSNVIFLGKNRTPIANVNQTEYIDYDTTY